MVDACLTVQTRCPNQNRLNTNNETYPRPITWQIISRVSVMKPAPDGTHLLNYSTILARGLLVLAHFRLERNGSVPSYWHEWWLGTGWVTGQDSCQRRGNQQTHNAKTTPLLRQNDVATSFRGNNDATTASSGRVMCKLNAISLCTVPLCDV